MSAGDGGTAGGEKRSWASRHPALLGLLSFLAGMFVGPILLVALIGATLVSPSPSRPAVPARTVAATPAPVQTVTATPTGPVTAFGPGMYHVGVDIEPGTYQSAGGRLCYWERLRAPDGTFDAIIANNLGEGPSLVTVNLGEFFRTTGCEQWTKR